MREPYCRMAILTLNNETIGDGDFRLEIAKTLREYADALEANQAGREHVEIWDNERGTKMVAVGCTWYGDRIPRRAVSADNG